MHTDTRTNWISVITVIGYAALVGLLWAAR